MADPRFTANSRGYVFDSSIATWIPDPKTAAGGGGGGGSTQVAVSSVAGIVTTQGNSTVIQGTSPWVIVGNSTVVPLRASTCARSSVTQSSTSVTLISANAARLGLTIYNRPTQSAELFVKFGPTASTSDFDVSIPSSGYYELPDPIYTGRIDGVWHSTGAGFARVCEWLA